MITIAPHILESPVDVVTIFTYVIAVNQVEARQLIRWLVSTQNADECNLWNEQLKDVSTFETEEVE